ncbi:N-acetylneuraminate synthase [Anaeromusa acidaminophila]|uniref:N-acetylneuraminate synthase n=1 Tax=Anaeromusa acidaminophila TaxID=81464 RepID=UPI00036F8998|nr:N-acetylneuraminate synthase [Anaeromusa acidaminophila]
MTQKRETYIIAEAGVNHNGCLQTAMKMVAAAADAGANAIKFQAFKSDKLVTRYAPKAAYQQENTRENSGQYEMLQKLELRSSDFLQLKNYCVEKGIEFLATPFDEDSLNFLVDSCGLKIIKISSGDLTNAPFLLQAAKTGLPIILSTGMATVGEIEKALAVLAYGYSLGIGAEKFTWDDAYNAYISEDGQQLLHQRVTLLHCTTEYPAPMEEVNLLAMQAMKSTFGLPVGYSDHTEGLAVSIGAVALGACMLEKHFTLDKQMAGPDHKASLEPAELKQLTQEMRNMESALGNGIKAPGLHERKNRLAARKSLVAGRKICEGEIFTKENLTIKRPGNGVSPERYWDYLGTRALKDYTEDELV